MVWWRWRALPVAMVCRVLVTVMLAVVFSLVPPVVVELGFRGGPNASAGPTVNSGASGDGGAVRARAPPRLCSADECGLGRSTHCSDLSAYTFATDDCVEWNCQDAVGATATSVCCACYFPHVTSEWGGRLEAGRRAIPGGSGGPAEP